MHDCSNKQRAYSAVWSSQYTVDQCSARSTITDLANPVPI
jgi:hypothetical protein